jgi:hypothetical protein
MYKSMNSLDLYIGHKKKYTEWNKISDSAIGKQILFKETPVTSLSFCCNLNSKLMNNFAVQYDQLNNNEINMIIDVYINKQLLYVFNRCVINNTVLFKLHGKYSIIVHNVKRKIEFIKYNL